MRAVRKLVFMVLTNRSRFIRMIVRRLWQEPVVLGIGRLRLLDWKLLSDISLSLGLADLALTCHRQALALSPKSAVTNFQVASALMELGRYEESLSFYDATITINSEWFGAYEVYGRCLWVCGQYERAAEVWNGGLAEQRRQAEL